MNFHISRYIELFGNPVSDTSFLNYDVYFWEIYRSNSDDRYSIDLVSGKNGIVLTNTIRWYKNGTSKDIQLEKVLDAVSKEVKENIIFNLELFI